MIRWTIRVIVAVCGLSLWSLVASAVSWAIYLRTLAFPLNVPAAWFIWWRMLPWWNADPWAELAIFSGGAVATIMAGLLTVLLWPLRPMPKLPALYGNTTWATGRELQRGGLREKKTPL